MQRPLRPCGQPGCGGLTRGHYCEAHATVHEESKAQARAARNRQYDEQHRDKTASAFYSSREWRWTRQRALVRDNGLCVHCLERKKITPADMVDHIIPIKIAFNIRISLSNLQSLCNKCHGIKTSKDELNYRNKLE